MRKYTVDIVLPAYNEEEQIEDSVKAVSKYCLDELKNYQCQVIIADNNSNDDTPKIGKKLEKKYGDVKFDRLNKKGRGRSLMKVWGESDADVCCYMDVDLSTDIKHLKDLLDAITKKKYDLAVGSRNLKESEVMDRGLKRTIVSKGYITIIKLFSGIKISDAQCGFKAISRKAADELLPTMNPDNWKGSAWFFDTEILVIAKRAGYKVCELPVKWTDDPGSTVHIIDDAIEDLRGLWRLKRTKPWKQLSIKNK